MPISFSCSCGKRLKVADNLVGKKVKCPGCQSVTLVPAQDGDETAAAPKAKPSMPAAKPGMKPPAPDKTAPTAKSKPAAPAAKRPAPPDDEPDLSDLFGGDEEETPKPVAKKKPAKPIDDDLEDLEEPIAKPGKKKPVQMDEDDDLGGLGDLGDLDDEPVVKPGKKKPVKVEMDEDEELEDEPPAKPLKKGKKPAVEDEEEEDEPKPRGKKGAAPAAPAKKSKKGLLIVVAVVLLLLVGGAAGYYFLFMDSPPPPRPMAKGPAPAPVQPPVDDKKGPGDDEGDNPLAKEDGKKGAKKTAKKGGKTVELPAEMKGIPAQAVGFVSFRVADWWNGKSGKAIQELPAIQAVSPFFDQFGISPADIERVQISFYPTAKKEEQKADDEAEKKEPKKNKVSVNFHMPTFGAILTKKPFDWEEFRKKIPVPLKEIDIDGKKAYQPDPKKEEVIHFASETLVITADLPIMKEYLAGNLSLENKDLDPQLEQAAGKHLFISGKLADSGVDTAALKPSISFTGLDVLSGLKSFIVSANDGEDSDDLQLEVRLTFEDESKAKELEEQANKKLAEAKAHLEKLGQDPDALEKKPLEKKLLPRAIKALEDTKIEVTEATFVATTTVPSIAELVPLAQSMMMPMSPPTKKKSDD